MHRNSGWQNMGLCETLTFSAKSLNAFCTCKSIARLICGTEANDRVPLRRFCRCFTEALHLSTQRVQKWDGSEPEFRTHLCQKWRADPPKPGVLQHDEQRESQTTQTSVMYPTDLLRAAALVSPAFLGCYILDSVFGGHFALSDLFPSLRFSSIDALAVLLEQDL